MVATNGMCILFPGSTEPFWNELSIETPNSKIILIDPFFHVFYSSFFYSFCHSFMLFVILLFFWFFTIPLIFTSFFYYFSFILVVIPLFSYSFRRSFIPFVILLFLFSGSIQEKTFHLQKAKHSLKKRQKSKTKKKREIRLFVSSTFRDFTQEREELIKKTFQEVRRMENVEDKTKNKHNSLNFLNNYFKILLLIKLLSITC